MHNIYKKVLTFSELINTAGNALKNCFRQLMSITIFEILIASINLKGLSLCFSYLSSVKSTTDTVFFLTISIFLILAYLSVISITTIGQAVLVKKYFDTDKPLSFINALNKGLKKVKEGISTQLTLIGICIISFLGTILSLIGLYFLNLNAHFSTLFDNTKTLKTVFLSPSLWDTFFLTSCFIVILLGMTFLWYSLFFFEAVAFDNKSNLKAVVQSYQIVKGNWWKTFIFMLFITLLCCIFEQLCKPILFLNFIVTLITMTFLSTARVVLYLNLRSQK
jgi:hypothetical protein